MTFLELIAKAYPSLYQSIVKPKPPEPVALQMLHDFKGFAAKIDSFRAQPNDGAKYLYLQGNGPWPTNEYLGITPGWVNAVAYEGLLNGRSVWSFRGDPTTAQFSWTGGMPPAQYVAPQNIADGHIVLQKCLLDASAASPYLQSLGLTSEAIAAAAGRG
jgi:hypothetical protein